MRDLPIPVEAGEPVPARVVFRAGHPEQAWTLAWAFEGGRRLEPFGKPYRVAREACREARRINVESGAEA